MAIMPSIFLEAPSFFSKRNRHPHSLYAKWVLNYV
jgi:hypothetical protein